MAIEARARYLPPMSIPIDHHYLPEFYLRRWTRAGKLYRYVRPIESARIHQKKVSPAATGYEPHLYSYTTGDSDRERTRLEHGYFQLIDDRAAKALVKLENMEPGSAIDHVGLVQFVISLLHRSPRRMDYLRKELTKRMLDVTEFDPSRTRDQNMIRDHVNDLLVDLISSDTVLPELVGMKVFRVPVHSMRRLVTSDMPIMLSQGTRNRGAFIMLPYAPDRLIIFAREENVALAFSTQEHDVLVNGLNDAIIRQAQQVIIAADDVERTFIEERFNPFTAPDGAGDDGLVRWIVP